MMNTIIKKSPNLVIPPPRRERDEEIDNEDGIIYPPGYSVASPIPIIDPNTLPFAPVVPIEEPDIPNPEEKRSRFDPFRPIHPQCNHISYGCLTMVFIVFVGMAVLLKIYLPDVLQLSDDESVIPHPSTPRPTVTRSNPPSMSTEPTPSPSFLPTVTRSNPPSISTEPSPSPSFLPTRSNPPSMYPSHPPSITIYEEKKLVASDGRSNDYFGASCSMSGDLVVIGFGADGVDDKKGAAYLFHLDGTEVAKLTPGDDGGENDWFGGSVAIDEKIVVGTGNADYIRVFSRNGIYERTIRCEDCSRFGRDVATLGNLIVTNGVQNSINKLFIYTTEEGELLKTLEQGSTIWDVAISEQFIVSTAQDGGKTTIIYSNTSPDFPKEHEINQGGREVAISNDRIVISDRSTNGWDGTAYLTDGTLVKTLDRQDASIGSRFGESVAITDDKVFVGAREDGANTAGSVYIYSAETGDFIKKVVAPDGEANDSFGTSVCASDSYFVIGAYGDDSDTGAAYLFQLP